MDSGGRTNVGYGNIKERAPEDALWFLVFNFEMLNLYILFDTIFCIQPSFLPLSFGVLV